MEAVISGSLSPSLFTMRSFSSGASLGSGPSVTLTSDQAGGIINLAASQPLQGFDPLVANNPSILQPNGWQMMPVPGFRQFALQRLSGVGAIDVRCLNIDGVLYQNPNEFAAVSPISDSAFLLVVVADGRSGIVEIFNVESGILGLQPGAGRVICSNFNVLKKKLIGFNFDLFPLVRSADFSSLFNNNIIPLTNQVFEQQSDVSFVAQGFGGTISGDASQIEFDLDQQAFSGSDILDQIENSPEYQSVNDGTAVVVFFNDAMFDTDRKTGELIKAAGLTRAKSGLSVVQANRAIFPSSVVQHELGHQMGLSDLRNDQDNMMFFEESRSFHINALQTITMNKSGMVG